MLGIFRLVCANGLVTGSTFRKTSIRHVGSALDQVMGSVESVIQDVPKLESCIQSWQGIELSEPTQIQFEVQAFNLIKPTKDAIMLDQDVAFRAIRSDDSKSDLWTSYNRIQERILGGGIRYDYLDEDGKLCRNSTRAIKSIDRSTKINQLLFDLAASYAKGGSND